MRTNKYRSWNEFLSVFAYFENGEYWYDYGGINFKDGSHAFDWDNAEQYTGLKDNSGKEMYHNDIGVFDNGDKFIIQMEDWLEFYVDWIGEPECEDQVRDFYRIRNAKIICKGEK